MLLHEYTTFLFYESGPPPARGILKGMLARYTHRGLTWIDLESPTPAEVRQIMEEFEIHPLIGEELLSPSLKPKVDRYDNCIYLILHFPAFGKDETAPAQEVDFILGTNFIITTRYETVDPFLKFSRVFETNSLLNRESLGSHAGFIFFFMMRNLYRALEHQLESVSMSLGRIEDGIFGGQERAMVFRLSGMSRVLLNFKQTLSPHKQVLESLEAAGVRFFGQDFVYHLRSISGDYYRVAALLESHKDVLSELRATNDSLLTTKQNEIMKVLTIMAFVTFPLTLISSVFGMNTQYLPIVGAPGDFWYIIGIMIALASSFFLYFRHKHWL
jgi:magnesium transporter